MIPRNKIERIPEGDHKNDSNTHSLNVSGRLMWIVFLMLPFLLGSCEAVAGIFKAGMGFGIFLVVAVIIAIVVFVMRMGKNRN